MEYREFRYQGKSIRGFFYRRKRKEVVLVVHGFTGNKVDHHRMLKIFSEDVAECGYSVYRFDFLGNGDSDGDFYKEEGIKKQIQQLVYIISEFQKEGYAIHLLGFSLGGVICSQTSNICNVKTLLLLSPAGNFNEIIDVMCCKTENGIEVNGFGISKEFYQEAKLFLYFDRLENSCEKVKILQGTEDEYVSKESFYKFQDIYSKCEAVWIEEANHCYSTIKFTNAVRKEIKEFYGERE